MTRLEKLRKRLGQCDEILLDAILMRHHIIKDIMAYKEENGLNILDPEQEERQKEWLDGRLENESNANEVWDIFHAIGKASKQMQARKLFDYNIVLIGFMGAGKTSISEYLKTLFAMDVIEMDQIIAEREGMSIPDIFEVHGEQYFRDLETNLLIEMQSRKNVVISCGGIFSLINMTIANSKKRNHMYIMDGIVYAGEPTESLEITKVNSIK